MLSKELIVTLPYRNDEVITDKLILRRFLAVREITTILTLQGEPMTMDDLKKTFLLRNPHSFYKGKRLDQLIRELVEDVTILHTYDNRLRPKYYER